MLLDTEMMRRSPVISANEQPRTSPLKIADVQALGRRKFGLSAISAAVLLFGSHSTAADEMLIELDPPVLPIPLADLQVAFCATDLTNGNVAVLNAEDIQKRHVPWSSFKIVNLIIALETGTVSSLDHRRRWDPERRPDQPYWPPAWRQDQTLRTAFRQSVPWYFQDIALKVGARRYRSDLTRFGYGNAAVPDGSDSFWLGGPLEVSPFEQMQFIRRLVGGRLALSPHTWKAVRRVSMVKADGVHVLYGKTGSGPLQHSDFGGPFEGWFVGWVEHEEAPNAAFALYVSGPSYQSIRTARLEITETLLMNAGLLPMEWS